MNDFDDNTSDGFDNNMIENIKKDIQLSIEEIEANIQSDVVPKYEELNPEFFENVLNSLNEIRCWW
jgi:archaellum component FlaC